jgi:hypothetical protein
MERSGVRVQRGSERSGVSSKNIFLTKKRMTDFQMGINSIFSLFKEGK